MANEQQRLLETIHSPRDLDALNDRQLQALCAEIRETIINTVSRTGGHLASNLGVVELTVALHRCLRVPDDQIVWDVGHQCYAHKLLTGRFDRISTLRQKDGIAGFPDPQESPYDAFIAGHSSTAVSAACGMARAHTLAGDDHVTVAVLGDGAFTGGLAWEGLNNAGHSNDRLIVILNDNRMSIGHNVGFVARYLANLRARSHYVRFKRRLTAFLQHIPLIGKPMFRLLLRAKIGIKFALYDTSTIFEDMGFYYFGPIDGHNIRDLTQALKTARGIQKPVLLHVETSKGKGYRYAEQNPDQFHGVSGFDRETGETAPVSASYSSVLGEELIRLAATDDRLVAITAAMKDGTGLAEFSQHYPERFCDVGIAEEHAVTFASGLASQGMHPVFAVYSTFLQRCYDQLLNDTAISQHHVVLAIDRAGLVPGDGCTHQGVFDTAFLQTIPHVTLWAPASFKELRLFLKRAIYQTEGIAALRYSRGGERPLPAIYQAEDKPFSLYKAPSAQVLLITYGSLFSQAMEVQQRARAQGVGVDVLKLNQIIPLPTEVIELAAGYGRVFFAEEGTRSRGIGETFGFQLRQAEFEGEYALRGIERFLPACTVAEGLTLCHLDTDSLTEWILGLPTGAEYGS